MPQAIQDPPVAREGTSPQQTGTVTVIIPTYHERENLPELINRLGLVREKYKLDLDLLLMDDDSRDGSAEYVREQAPSWARLVTRTKQRGLSAAVLDGVQAAKGERLVVMDADLSHPPEKLPELLAALDAGADFAIGSRYIDGGGTTDDWHVLRRVNSRAATLLARPFTRAKDPMAGFFCLSRATLGNAKNLDPVGYKIGLELLVKCGVHNVKEVPILFADRKLGESKLTLKEQIRYLEHLRRLAVFKFGVRAMLAFFVVAGVLGAIAGLDLLAVLRWLGAPMTASLLWAVPAFVVVAGLVNRLVTFRDDLPKGWSASLGVFLVIAAVSGVIQGGMTIPAYGWIEHAMPGAAVPYLASMCGMAAGAAANLALCLLLIFRRGQTRGASFPHTAI